MGVGAVIEVTGRTRMTELQGRNLYRYNAPLSHPLHDRRFLHLVGAAVQRLYQQEHGRRRCIGSAQARHPPSSPSRFHRDLSPHGAEAPLRDLVRPGPARGAGRPDRRQGAVPSTCSWPWALLPLSAFVTGVFPGLLYDLLPYPVTYAPYTGYQRSRCHPAPHLHCVWLSSSFAGDWEASRRSASTPTGSTGKGGWRSLRLCNVCSAARSSLPGTGYPPCGPSRARERQPGLGPQRGRRN